MIESFLTRAPGNQLIGMVHVAALPGTPCDRGEFPLTISQAAAEAKILADCGFHAVLVENMHDRPYLKKSVGPEVVSAMTAVAREVKSACGLPVGIQILAGANREALAVALAAGLDFVRVEGFVFAHVADEGIIDGCAGELLRYRKAIGANHIAVFTDVKKKHASHALTADVDIAETVMAAEFFLSDGVIVTGTRTGLEADTADLAHARAATNLPVIVGSGVTPANIADFLEHADALIVGSAIKEDGRWDNPLDEKRAKNLVKAAGAALR